MRKLGALVLACGCMLALAGCNENSGGGSIIKVSDEAEYTLIQNDTQKAYELVSGACIGVTASRATGSNTGSAVIYKIENNRYYAVTNAHVIKGASSVSVTLPDDKYNTAQVLGYDETNDIAVLSFKLDILNGSLSDKLTNVGFMSYSDNDLVKVGQTVMAIGCPLGVSNFNILTTGVVSSVSSSQISTDAAINPGSSGGGLFNLEGRLIGIVREKDVWKSSSGSSATSITKTDTPVEGRGYAIPLSVVKNCVEQIEKNEGIIERPSLGITLTTINTILKPQHEYKKYVPADDLYVHFIVTQFENDSAAQKCGIKTMDVILEIDGVAITNATKIDEILNLKTMHEKVTVKVYRTSGDTASAKDIEVSFI